MSRLEEAIKRYTDNAEYERTHGNLQGCLDFKQLAEWLRELKAYRDGCHCDTCKYSDKNIKNRPCGYCGDNESNWEYGGEVNADDTNRCKN